MDKKISVSQIKEVAQEAYEMFKTNTGGKNADYIPYLANIDKNLFGISICLMDGTLIQLGDSPFLFGRLNGPFYRIRVQNRRFCCRQARAGFSNRDAKGD